MNRTLVIAAALALLWGGLVFPGTGRAAWKAPLGIPTPTFGINETAPPPPSPWSAEVPGFYYIDYGAGNDARMYGTPAAPRQTIPTVLPAGSYVEVHGTYPQDHQAGVVANGTAASPVWIRGAGATARPVFTHNLFMTGTYYIVENIEFFASPDAQGNGGFVALSPTNNGAFRNNEVHGTADSGGTCVCDWGGGIATNVVFYNNWIHDNGDVNANFDQDVHGITVNGNVQNLWIVDNRLARNSGDGIQVNGGTGGQTSLHHVYIGRNVSFANKQTGMWTKQASDVIFSQNEVYGHRFGNSSNGAGMGGQYGPNYVWYLFNKIHDNEFGINLANDIGDGYDGTESFFIGNIIWNIHAGSDGFNPDTGYQNAAIGLWGGVNRYVVNNTIYDVDSGIASPGGIGKVVVVNTIIDKVTRADGAHIFLEMENLAMASAVKNSLFGGRVRIKWGGRVVETLAQFTSSVTGQQVGTLNKDPMFVNAAAGDFRLQPASPARGAGIGDAAYDIFARRYGINIRPDPAPWDLGGHQMAAGKPALPAATDLTVSP